MLTILYSLLMHSCSTCTTFASAMSCHNLSCFQYSAHCGSLVSPPDGPIVTLNGTSFRSIATYTCSDEPEVDCTTTRVCLEDRAWSGVEPVCGGELHSESDDRPKLLTYHQEIVINNTLI